MSAPPLKTSHRILPRDQGAAPLDVVIGVMAFLAALALGASLVANRTAEGWRAGLAGKITVQVLPPRKGPPEAGLDREFRSAVAILQSTPGIVNVTPLSQQDALALVKPWIGAGELVAELPLPRLIDADIAPGDAPDLANLRKRLARAAPDATLDDHSHWIARLKALADSIIWSSYGILFLIAIATASTVTFATRAGLEAHHEIVALLHQMGAQSSFIARAFERHYFISALVASLVGAAMAALVFFLAGGLQAAGEAVPFLPPLSLSFAQMAWLIAVPIVTSAIAWATARLSVLAVLREIY